MPSDFAPPQIDFSWLANLPERYQQGVEWNQKQDAVRRQDELRAAFANGLPMKGDTVDWDAVTGTIARFDPVLGANIAAKRAEAEARANELPTDVRVAEYFASLPEGDPRLKYAPRNQAQRTLPRIAINDLTVKGTFAENTTYFRDSFKPEYGGWKTDTAGNAANYAARNLGIGNKEAASWWQDYQYHTNQVRKDLFGTALTKQEQAQWNRANITPGMEPDVIATNLRRRAELEMRGARRLARTYLKQGYPQDVIEEAVGFGLDDAPPPEAGTGQELPLDTPLHQWDEPPETRGIDPAGRTVVPQEEASAAPQASARPPVPPSLRGRQLDFSRSMNLFRDRKTGERFNVNGEPVDSQ